jgi:hypothetical protein
MKKSIPIVIIISMIAIMPLSIVLFASNFANKDYNAQHQTQIGQILLSVYNFEEKRIVTNIRQDSIILSKDQTIAAGTIDECNDTLSKFASQNPQYTNVVLFNSDGTVRCGAVLDNQSSLTVSGDSFFTDAIYTKNFTIGKYRIGKITSKPLIPFGYPVYKKDGTLSGVLTLGLDIKWLENYFQSLSIIEGTSVALLDQNGTIIYNDSVETFTMQPETIKKILSSESQSTINNSVDEEKSGKKYMYVKLTNLTDNPLNIVISFDQTNTQSSFQEFIQDNVVLTILTVTISILISSISYPYLVKRF